MRSGYLRKTAQAASRTSSPAKALRTGVPMPVPRVSAALPGLIPEMPPIEDAGLRMADKRDVPVSIERTVPIVPVAEDASNRPAAAVPLSAAIRKLTTPAQAAGDEVVREAPPAMAQSTKSAAQRNAMSGVLQRLSRPATQVVAPPGLRQMRPAPAVADSMPARMPAAEVPHPQAEQRNVHADRNEGSDVQPRMHVQKGETASSDFFASERKVDSPLESDRSFPYLAYETRPTPQMEPSFEEGPKRTSVERHEEIVVERVSAGRVEHSSHDLGVFQQPAKTLPEAEKTGRATPRPVEHATSVAAAATGSAKSERKISIGKIDVHVNNQPAPRRANERTGAVAQQSSALHPVQDVSRFLLKY